MKSIVDYFVHMLIYFGLFLQYIYIFFLVSFHMKTPSATDLKHFVLFFTRRIHALFCRHPVCLLRGGANELIVGNFLKKLKNYVLFLQPLFPSQSIKI